MKKDEMLEPEFIKSCYELPEEWKRQMATPEYKERVLFINMIDGLIKLLPEKYGTKNIEVLRADDLSSLKYNRPIGKLCWQFFVVKDGVWNEEPSFSLKIEAPKFRVDRDGVIKEVENFANNFMNYYRGGN